MIVLKILTWIFIVVLMFVMGQFLIAVYDALNFKNEPLNGGFQIIKEILQEAVLTFFSVLTYGFGFFNYDYLFLKSEKKQYPPVLLVHGYTMNRACFIFIHLRLVMDGFRVFTVNLYPPFSSIESLSDIVADKMDEIAEKTGEKEAYLVCHSMGGLVARYYSATPRGVGRVKKLITIATPHNGTRIAVLGKGRNAEEMKPGSEFLKKLNELPVPEIYAIWSTLDNLIIPPERAFIKGMPNTSLQFKGHITLLYSNEVYKHIKDTLTPKVG